MYHPVWYSTKPREDASLSRQQPLPLLGAKHLCADAVFTRVEERHRPPHKCCMYVYFVLCEESPPPLCIDLISSTSELCKPIISIDCLRKTR